MTMKPLVYLVLVDMSVPLGYKPGDLDAMFDLWVRHLKGPGGYDGEILILTNRPGFRCPGVKPVRIEGTFERIPDAHVAHDFGDNYRG